MRSKQHKAILVSLALLAILAVSPLVNAYFSRDWVSPVPLAQSDLAREGIVEPAITTVSASVAGRVKRVMVKPGAIVKAGQPLVELTNPSVTSRLELARAELAAATAPFCPYTIRTPIAGTVLKVYRTAGSVAPAGQPVLAIGDPTRLTVSVPATSLARLPVPGQLAWVYSSVASTVTASVASVEAERIIVSLPAQSVLHLGEPVQVRFDTAEPIVMASGVVSGDVLILSAGQDGRLSYVAPEGSVVTAGQEVATVEREAMPDAAAVLLITKARENLRQAEAEADGLIIRAPTDGTVLALTTQRDCEVTAGATVAQLGDPADLQVTVTILPDQTDLWLQGQPVTVVGDGFQSEERVTRVFGSGSSIVAIVKAPSGAAHGQRVRVLPIVPKGVLVPATAVHRFGTKAWVETLGWLGPRKLEAGVVAKVGDWVIITGVDQRKRLARFR